MNLVELYDENYRKYGEYVTTIFEEEEWTNLRILKRANRLAKGLKKLGIEYGDRVIVILSNSPEVFVSYQGILRCGAIVVPLLFLYQPEEIAYVAQDCSCKAIITESNLLPKVLQAKKIVASKENNRFDESNPYIIIAIGEEAEGVISYEKLIEEVKEEGAPTPSSDEDTAVIIYTSGTTGKPKGCCLSHSALYYNAQSVSVASEVKIDEIGLLPLPLAHVYGIVVMCIGLIIKTKGVLMRWFEVETALRLIEKYKVETMAGVPTMYAYMVNFKDSDKYNTSTLRRCGCAAAPMPIELIKRFEEKFKSAKIYEGYGLTETAAAVTVTSPSIERKLGSPGKPIPGLEVKIFDEEDKELPPNRIGEIVVRGPTVMKGYYNRPEETKEALRSGWLHTGDMGYLDEDGYLFITERKKDMIIRGGINIYPREIEEVILTHPKVSDCAVVGIKDEIMGEAVKAFVVCRPGEKVTKEEIIEFCQNKLAKFKCPKFVEFRGFLPKNLLGKVLKRELRES